FFVVVAMFKTWQKEFHRTSTLQQQLNDLTVPKFVLDLHNAFAKEAGDNDSLVLQLLYISNNGAQSIIKNPTMQVVTPTGKTVSGRWLGVQQQSIKLVQPDGTSVELPPSMYLMSKAGETPIAHNGAAEGYMWWRFPGVKG